MSDMEIDQQDRNKSSLGSSQEIGFHFIQYQRQFSQPGISSVIKNELNQEFILIDMGFNVSVCNNE